MLHRFALTVEPPTSSLWGLPVLQGVEGPSATLTCPGERGWLTGKRGLPDKSGPDSPQEETVRNRHRGTGWLSDADI